MPYLLESELGLSYDLRLTEFGNMGHIVPNHGVVLDKVRLSVPVSVCPGVVLSSLCSHACLLNQSVVAMVKFSTLLYAGVFTSIYAPVHVAISLVPKFNFLLHA